MPRFPLLLIVCSAALLSACATDTPSSGDPASGDPPVVEPAPDNPGPAPVAGALPAEVLPFASSEAGFSTREGEVRDVRTEPTASGMRMTITSGGSLLGYLDWRREGESILLSDGPDRWIEMMRVGARPGDSWTSSGRTVRFDGWERVKTPVGDYDAVRITTSATTKDLEESETWWFAPGTGLIRLAQNKGDLFRTEMWRTR